MKIKKSALILSSTFLLIFLSFNNSVKAIPLIGNIYGSMGGAYTNDNISGSIKKDIKNDFSGHNNSNGNISFAIGLDSDIPLPIIHGLRFEFNYIKSLNSKYDNLKGGSIYYDFKLFPIVTPYIGASVFYYNPKVILHSSDGTTIKEKLNQGLTAFNAGLSLPLTGLRLTIFAEYRYAIPGVFKNKLAFNNNDIYYSNKNYNLSILNIGLRYSFL